MRFGSLAVALLAASSWSCKDPGGGSSLPADDYSETFTGLWIGTLTGTADGEPIPPSAETMEITREGSNRIRLGGLCPDDSSIPALVTGPTTVSVPAFTCPATPFTGCSAVTMAWSGGSGSLGGDVLTLEVAGTLQGCGQRFPITFDFKAIEDSSPPEIATLDPAAATIGDPGVMLTVTGTGFKGTSTVRWNFSALPTTYVSASELRALVSASLLGAAAASASVTVLNPDGKSSAPATFEVRNPVPVLTAVAPDTVLASTPGTTLTLTGSGFVRSSSGAWGGGARPTTYVSPTTLRMDLSVEDLVTGEWEVTVTSPGPGGGTSAPLVLHVVNPAPVATSLLPASIPAGAARFFVTVAGASFVPDTTVLWNGAPRRTRFVSSTLLSAEVAADDVVEAGSAQVSVSTPPPGGGSALAGTFTIGPPVAASGRSVAYQIDPAHSGRARSGGTLAFPRTSAWSVALPDLVSYPLIADGKVFVLVRGPSTSFYGTRLVALDLATGAMAWGPVEIAGTYMWSGHAYENGRLFVVNFDGRLRSFDAATGTPGWSVSLPGQYAFSAPPTAVGGIVYVGGAGSGGTVYAVDASTGNVRWTAGVANGDVSSPAVAPDAVYVSYPCQVYKLDLSSGAQLWHPAGGCSGGGGKTAAYADGALYVRDFVAFDAPVGAIYDGLDGSRTGAFGSAGKGLPIPALDGAVRYQLVSGALERWDPGAEHSTWSFTGDGQLVSAPIVVDDAVVVGSGSGTVFAVDAKTGLERWSDAAGAAVLGPDEQNVSQPLTGLGAGEGYLVVPAGKRVTAWKIVAP